MRIVLLTLLISALLAIPTACASSPIPTAGPAPARTETASRTVPRPTGTAAPMATPAPTATPKPNPKVLRINLAVRPDMLDPQKAFTPGAIAVLQLAYEGLTHLDENGHVQPGAAESWEFSGDGKTLTFHLRPGLVRADGTPLVAQDFEFAFKHAVDPRVASPNESFLDDVHGAVAAYSLDPKSQAEEIERVLSQVGVKAIDDTTLVISFDQPTGYWPSIASTYVAWPSDKTKIESGPDTWWTRAENHNGNGAFRITEIGDQAIKLVPNPHYWGGTSQIDRIEFYWISDPNAALESFRKGDLEILRLTTDQLEAVKMDPVLSKELVQVPVPQVAYLGFNVKKPPFTDRNLRKAFSQALDREALVRDLLKGAGKPYLSWIPSGTPGYDESAVAPGYDPQAAVQTLVDAGYGTPDKKRVDCIKLGAIKLSFANTARYQAFFQMLAGNLMRVFACPIVLDPIEPGTYAIMEKDPKVSPQLFLVIWQEEYSHPQDWLFLQTCAGVFAKRTGYCSKDFDGALSAANQELDFGAAIAKYKSAQSIFVSDLSAAFLWQTENSFLVQPYVRRTGNSSGAFWPAQSSRMLNYDVNLSKVGAGYPAR